MAGYEGYFLKGLASTLPSLTGQVQQLKLKKGQRKKAEEAKQNLQDAIAQFNINNKETLDLIEPGKTSQIPSTGISPGISPTGISGIGSQGVLSNPALIPLLAAAGAVSDSMVSAFKEVFLAIDEGNVTRYEKNMEYINNMIGHIKEINLAGGDVNSYYGFQDLVTDESKKWFRAAEVYGKTPAAKMPYEMTEQVGEMAGLTMPKEAPMKATMADEKSAINLLRSFIRATPEQYERQRRNLEQRTGLDLSIYTQDILREAGTEVYNLYNTPEEVMSNVKAPAGLNVIPKRDTKTGKYYGSFSKETAGGAGGYRATSLNTQEDYKQKALGTNTLEDKNKVVDTYEKAGYDPSEMPTDQEWIDGKLEELESHVQMLKEITDENGKLIGDKSFKFMSGDEEESKTGTEWYKDIYEAYTFYLEELKKMGIDVSKYPKIKSPAEASKVGFFKGAFTPGVEKGYPSIYYTETTPTPTETETPKLPSF